MRCHIRHVDCHPELTHVHVVDCRNEGDQGTDIHRSFPMSRHTRRLHQEEHCGGNHRDRNDPEGDGDRVVGVEEAMEILRHCGGGHDGQSLNRGCGVVKLLLCKGMLKPTLSLESECWYCCGAFAGLHNNVPEEQTNASWTPLPSQKNTSKYNQVSPRHIYNFVFSMISEEQSEKCTY